MKIPESISAEISLEEEIPYSPMEFSNDEIYEGILLDTSYHFEAKEHIYGKRYTNDKLPIIEKFVEKVLATDRMGFNFDKGITILKPLGSYVHYIDIWMDDYDDRYRYSPNVQAFFDAYKKVIAPIYMGCPTKEIDLQRATAFNSLIGLIRTTGKSEKFKKEISRRSENSSRNQKSLICYKNKLLNFYSKLLIIRIDLSYRDQTINEINIHSAQRHRDKLLNNIRFNKLFKHLVGYIWKLEYGDLKGHHFHFIFFFDGSKVIKDEYIAWMIGLYWENEVTKGIGCHYNCNANKNKYKHQCIGMLHYADQEKREKLNIALKYLAKKQQYLLVKSQDNCRIIGKGVAPIKKNNAGRPRMAS